MNKESHNGEVTSSNGKGKAITAWVVDKVESIESKEESNNEKKEKVEKKKKSSF